jgi:hypothetical protein
MFFLFLVLFLILYCFATNGCCLSIEKWQKFDNVGSDHLHSKPLEKDKTKFLKTEAKKMGVDQKKKNTQNNK